MLVTLREELDQSVHALLLDLPDDLVGRAVVVAILCEEPHQPLVDDRCRDDLDAGQRTQPSDEALGVGAAAIDDFADPRATEAGRVNPAS